MSHWIEDALIEGFRQTDVDEALRSACEHVTTEGEWEQGVISPSLVAKQCRLQRLKAFLGHAPQPGMKRMAVNRGKADALSTITLSRGFLMEGMIVPALRKSLGDRVMAHAPLFTVRHLEELDGGAVNYAGHPDMIVSDDHDNLWLVQIKCPSVFKLERVKAKGKDDAWDSYGSQMATEMFITRAMGIPVVGNILLLASWDTTPKMKNPHILHYEYEWEEQMATIPREVAHEILDDLRHLKNENVWPAALPEHAWDVWPCSYCNHARLGDFETIGCTESQEWDRFEKTGETRLTVAASQADQAIRDVPVKRRARR